MPFSEVDIYNLALTNAKAKSFVQLLTEETLERKYCTANFKPSVEYVLEAHDWGFASRTIPLALKGRAGDDTTEAPPPPWQYAYDWPSDCVAFREVVRQSDDLPAIPYAIGLSSDGTGRRILTDEPVAYGRFTARVLSPNLFSAMFIDALGWRLAMRVAPPLIGENAPLRYLTTMYQNSVSDAQTKNRNQAQKREEQTNMLIQSRR